MTDAGLDGHLMHLYDNRSLTFGEIKKIIIDASKASLSQVTEKMDGMNLVFTYDLQDKVVRVARGSSIKSGGMTAADLASKFRGRGQVEAAFNTAYEVLTKALKSLSTDVKRRVFGAAGNVWYSMEIIYVENPNVIQYDSNNIVFHGWPVFEKDTVGNVRLSRDETGVEILTDHLEKMQASIDATGWYVRGPSLVRMQKLSDGSILNDTLIKLNNAMMTGRVKDDDTILQYLKNMYYEEVRMLRLSSQLSAAIVSRCVEEPGCPSLIDIKKMSNKMSHSNIVTFVKSSPAMTKTFMLPIEIAINGFAIEILKGLKSTLVSDSSSEVMRLRSEVQGAIASIEGQGVPADIEKLHRQLQRLGSIDNITSPMEGIVFRYKGNAYKFTGAFAAANQILGLLKYKKDGK
jgi:hypothetical protein